MNITKMLSIIGSVSSIVGAALVASGISNLVEIYGYIIMSVGCVAMMAWALRVKEPPQLAMFGFFLLLNSYGIMVR